MNSFIVHLVLDHLHLEVHFNGYYAPNGIRYFVYARTSEGTSWSFTMEKDQDEWRIVNAPRVEDLFLKNEKKFSESIITHQESSRQHQDDL